MKWLRHRKARADREAGMVFAWRISDFEVGRMVASIFVTGLAVALFAGMVHVRVDSPPRQSHRRGTVMLEPDEKTGWFERLCAENSPFPAPFDVWGFDDSSGALAKHPAWSVVGNESYVPKFRGLSEGADLFPSREKVFGKADLPPLPPIPAVPEVENGPASARRVAVLRADSAELAVRIPAPLPGLGLGVAGEPPPGEHRFLLELDSSGVVLSVAPMAPSGKAEAMGGIVQWLRGLRFKPAEPGEGARQWYVVTVSFVFSSGPHD